MYDSHIHLFRFFNRTGLTWGGMLKKRRIIGNALSDAMKEPAGDKKF